ncbi:hypothetical protein BJ138DRAFT_1105768 [Hygrophoropsis aurantiaca]|uniref:Uncharacterized protein n=1 Tax=Hygrophoropsis aurantiaca TaxID=72124 RepID=A0ACB7ZYB2_9AGAM|nr:hypothetical protein BJ138DRAFT_1105768 [Hygrophoropsis aurantiaca]
MDATTELLAENVVRMRLQRPPHFHWSVRQNAYPIVPSVSRLPFKSLPSTIASIDSSSPVSISKPKELVFIINVHKGFMKRLGGIVASNGETKVFVDGPYGFPPNLSSYDTSVLVVGGAGVSYTLPIFLDTIDAETPTIYPDGFGTARVTVVESNLSGPSVMLRSLGEYDSVTESTGVEQSFRNIQSIPGVKLEHGRPDLESAIREEIASPDRCEVTYAAHKVPPNLFVALFVTQLQNLVHYMTYASKDKDC